MSAMWQSPLPGTGNEDKAGRTGAIRNAATIPVDPELNLAGKICGGVGERHDSDIKAGPDN